MTPYGFLAWVATQGIKHIPKRLLLQAFNSFKGKLPGNQVILKIAKNLWDDVIKKTPTKDLTKQIRQKIKPVQEPRPFPGFKPTIVPKTKIVPKTPKIVPKKPDTLKDILQGKPHIDKQGRSWEFQKVPHPKGPAKIIPFPKIPRKPKADGGRIDKALSGRSRDI
jgi:hypothetical protein